MVSGCENVRRVHLKHCLQAFHVSLHVGLWVFCLFCFVFRLFFDIASSRVHPGIQNYDRSHKKKIEKVNVSFFSK